MIVGTEQLIERLVDADRATKTGGRDRILHDRIANGWNEGGAEACAARYMRAELGVQTYRAVTKLIDPLDLYLYYTNLH